MSLFIYWVVKQIFISIIASPFAGHVTLKTRGPPVQQPLISYPIAWVLLNKDLKVKTI